MTIFIDEQNKNYAAENIWRTFLQKKIFSCAQDRLRQFNTWTTLASCRFALTLVNYMLFAMGLIFIRQGQFCTNFCNIPHFTCVKNWQVHP